MALSHCLSIHNLNLRVSLGYETKEFSIVMISGESKLRQIVEEKIKLSEPGLKGTVYHPGEHS